MFILNSFNVLTSLTVLCVINLSAYVTNMKQIVSCGIMKGDPLVVGKVAKEKVSTKFFCSHYSCAVYTVLSFKM